MSKLVIGQRSPNISVDTWVQGKPANVAQQRGRVFLIEVFQVNCPGCFIYALPEVKRLHENFFDQGLTAVALATAFEDFDKNTLPNLS